MLIFRKDSFCNKEDPYAGIPWETRDICIMGEGGKPLFEKKGVLVPAFWSDTASNILASKYLAKFPIPGDVGGERDLRQAVDRIVDTITEFGLECNYFDKESSLIFSNSLKYMLVGQYGSFNSPVWFNCGLSKYGKTSKVPGYYWDPSLRSIVNGVSRPQCSACFIQSVQDDLGSIYDLLKKESMIFKHGSGSGTNFSNLRSKYETLSGGGYSSGLISFLEVYDRACGATKSGGITRRAAKMNVVDIDHPEILDFIRWKAHEEDKAVALLNAGYSGGMDGEAYHSVSGQNVNNTVRISDEFMCALEDKKSWATRFRKTKETHAIIGVDELFMEIAKAAWRCGDPGVQFSDNINKYNTCSVPIRGSNPCSEFMFIDDSACNLASLNLVKFIDPGTYRLNLLEFREAIKVFIVAQDILVDLSAYPTERIAINTHKYRPLGLGYTNLGSYLMRLGMPYGSDEACEETSGITAVMTSEAYEVSNTLGNILGCTEYDRMPNVFNTYVENVGETLWKSSFWKKEIERTDNFGFGGHAYACEIGFSTIRNSQVTLLAPTGTIGVLMDCDTTGIEPHYSLVTEKSLIGGGKIRKVSGAVQQALMWTGGFSSEKSMSMCNKLACGDALGSEEISCFNSDLFACAVGSNRLSVEAHLNMMSAAQMFLSGGISKTVNLPNDATIDDVAHVFKLSWELGLKSITVYRDGCKQVQPLKDVTAAQKVDDDDAFIVRGGVYVCKESLDEITEERRGDGMFAYNKGVLYVWKEGKWNVHANSTKIDGRRCLPDKRKGFTQKAMVSGQKIFLRTGEYVDGKLGELFVDMHKEGAAFRSLMNCFAMAVSLGLQYGVPLEKFVKLFTFTRFEPQGVVEGHETIKFATSIIDYIFRVLGIEYLGMKELGHVVVPKVEAKSPGDAPFCQYCGSVTVRSGTCFYCNNCGNTTGCS